jgi:hypothetical protein
MNTLSSPRAAVWIALAAVVAGCSGADASTGSESQQGPEQVQISADALSGSDVAVLPSTKQRCGGENAAGCPLNHICVYAAGGCVPGPGSTCSGTCEPQPPGAICGGQAGVPCPAGQTCALDSDSDCEPSETTVCPGVCASLD